MRFVEDGVRLSALPIQRAPPVCTGATDLPCHPAVERGHILFERLMRATRERGYEVSEPGHESSERSITRVGARVVGKAALSQFDDTILLLHVQADGRVSTRPWLTLDDLPVRLDVERRCFVAFDGGDALDVLMDRLEEVCREHLRTCELNT